MSNQLIPEFQQFFNADGVAESGLFLYTYEAGTFIEKETFQTYGGTANSNPIAMNASGYPPAGIYGSGSYRFILKDSGAVTLRDQDQIVLGEGLQPDANGDYIIPEDLNIQGTLTVNGVLMTGDGLGNLGLNGASIPSDLSTLYNYTFNGNNCVAENKTAGVVIYGNGCYPTSSSSIYKAIANSGRYPMITYVADGAASAAVFRIRQSTIIADSIDKNLGDVFTSGTTVTPS